MAVGIGYGLFIVEIRHVADASDDVPYSQLPADVHGQAVIAQDPDSFQVPGSLTDDVFPLLHGEKASLGLVDSDCHYDFVEDGQGSGKDVQMS